MNDDASEPQPADAERFRQKLETDARVWAADQGAASDRRDDEAADLAARQVKAAAAASKKRSRAKPAATVEAPKPADAKRPPFSMSYDGVSNAQYLSERAARGAR